MKKKAEPMYSDINDMVTFLMILLHYVVFSTINSKVIAVTFSFMHQLMSLLKILGEIHMYISPVSSNLSVLLSLLSLPCQASWVFPAAGLADTCLPTTGWRTAIGRFSSVQILQTVFISEANHWKPCAISYSWEP